MGMSDEELRRATMREQVLDALSDEFLWTEHDIYKGRRAVDRIFSGRTINGFEDLQAMSDYELLRAYRDVMRRYS